MDIERVFQKGAFKLLFRTVFSNGIVRQAAMPIDEKAVDALAAPGYHGGMVTYRSNYYHLSNKAWAEHYMAKQTVNS